VKALTPLRAPLIVLALAGLLSACNGSPIPSVAAGDSEAHALTSSHKKVFVYTGKKAKFVVPSGVMKLTIVADGAAGGGNTQGNYSEPPGFGGEVSANVLVRPGEKLYVLVGGEGNDHQGYNGGGQGGYSEYGRGFYGGGASDVREGGDLLRDRILVAGGGGGAGGGYYFSAHGGVGGGLTGGSGGGHGTSGEGGGGGAGGSQTTGGAGGAGGGSGPHAGQPGDNGSRGDGGDGGASGSAEKSYRGAEGGGGGGGGYYGGGGGGGGEPYGSCSCGGGAGGGGGGGSSYVAATLHRLSDKQGVWQSDGMVTISW
jgi:hypothetical protein